MYALLINSMLDGLSVEWHNFLEDARYRLNEIVRDTVQRGGAIEEFYKNSAALTDEEDSPVDITILKTI